MNQRLNTDAEGADILKALRTFLSQQSHDSATAALELAPGAVLHREGDCATHLSYVEEGRLVLSALSEQGRFCLIDIVGAGRLVGDECLDGRSEYASTAEAIAPTRILSVTREQAQTVLAQSSVFRDTLISAVLDARTLAHRRLVTRQSTPAEYRLAHLLVELATTDDGTLAPIRPRLTHDRLADLLGSTRPRVTVFMNQFKENGYITESGDAIVVHRAIFAALEPGRATRRAPRPKRDNLMQILDAIAADRGGNPPRKQP